MALQRLELEDLPPSPARAIPYTEFQTAINSASETWKDEATSPLDAWHSFNRPYRAQIAQVVTQYAPYRGSVAEVGCGPGINLFRLHLIRPDLMLFGVDINAKIAEWAKQLLRDSAAICVGNVLEFPLGAPVHVLFSVYVGAYFLPSQVSDYIEWAGRIAETVIFAEPTNNDATEDEGLKPSVFHAKPTPIFIHPYPELLRRAGWHVTTIPVPDEPALHKLNMITVGTRAERTAT